uniref:Uncharacterized protein n=1 Tax=viral metagenome TaxID=1070528 RepID=A0A6C0AD51_9ZZZZ
MKFFSWLIYFIQDYYNPLWYINLLEFSISNIF